MRGFIQLVICAVFVLNFSACQEDAGSLTLPSDQDKDYNLAFVDTTTLITSTVLLDSIPTSNAGALLFGKYQDPKLGLIESKAFFQVGLGNFRWIPDEDATYESVYLIMQPSGYYYGDTTKTHTIEVREIVDDFKSYKLPQFWIDEGLYSYFSKDKDKLYNNSKIKVNDSEVLGTTTFKIPNVIKDSIMVKLSDNLGTSWFQQAKAGANIFEFTSDFIKYFKGVSISTTDESNMVSVLPVKKISTSTFKALVKIRIYYKELVNGILTEKFYDFPFFGGYYDRNAPYNPENNFNQITSDRSGTLVENLTLEKNEIASTLTNDETYIQSGVGLATKIKFPSLRNIINLPGYLKINNAQLIIEPVRQTYNDDYFLPSKLTLFYCRANMPTDQVPADYPQSGYQEATIFINPELGTNSGYVFSLTQYMQQLLSSQANLNNVSLLVTAPVNSIGSSVTRTVIGNGQRANYRARLEIYYLKQNE